MKTDNQIAPHIRKTIEEIDGDIEQLNQDIAELALTRSTLVRLYSGETEIPAVPAKPAKAAKKAKAPKADLAAVAKEVGAQSGTTSSRGRAPSAETVKLMSVMRTVPEPFTMDSLRVASGITNTKTITNALTRGKVKGWLKSEAYGEYKRTGTFPTETPNE